MSLSKTLYLCLVLVQSRKTSPDKTDKLLTGMSNIMAVREQVFFSITYFGKLLMKAIILLCAGLVLLCQPRVKVT